MRRGLLVPQKNFATLKKVWEPLQVQGKQYQCGSIPALHSFKSPQGIAQWSALAAHWTLHNTYRKGGTTTPDALLTIWVKFTALRVGWEPLSDFSHVFHTFHARLLHFKNQGVVTGPCITYAEPSEKKKKTETIVCCVNGGFCVGSQPVCMLHRLFIVFRARQPSGPAPDFCLVPSPSFYNN